MEIPKKLKMTFRI
jgi:hypothetical protein